MPLREKPGRLLQPWRVCGSQRRRNGFGKVPAKHLMPALRVPAARWRYSSKSTRVALYFRTRGKSLLRVIATGRFSNDTDRTIFDGLFERAAEHLAWMQACGA